MNEQRFTPHASQSWTPASVRRADLHCHSEASNQAAEVALEAINCPECYSKPNDVYAQATGRGMDFVTITDHDTIDGALCIADRANVIVGEELTTWFPEDLCKMHILVWGIEREQHAQLQDLASNIYDVAAFIERHRLAHSVAHPIYRQNDKLERWHVERLLLMFKGFECLNGAHSSLHRDAFEPLLDRLTKSEIQRLAETHNLSPRWDEPWKKTRTAGSDDHGLLNIGRTWTEFPADVQTVDDVLNCLREGRCAPGGEAGSSAKLAHTFYSVAVRYYTNHLLTGRQANFATQVLQMIVGERPAPSKFAIAKQYVKSRVKKFGRTIVSPFSGHPPEPVAGTALLKSLFVDSAIKHYQEHPSLRSSLKDGMPPLGEHRDMFDFVSRINRDVSQGIADAINRSIDDASFTGLFDSIGAAIAQQFTLMPYYFAVFHQNKERHLLHEITRQHKPKQASTLRIGLFTDTIDEVNGVARFIRDMGEQAHRLGRHLTIHTCAPSQPEAEAPVSSPDSSSINRKNFVPLLSRPLPYYQDIRLNLPPLLDVLEWSDRQQFDAIHISTPGPMGLCGWIVSKMLRVPLLATYHTDFPAYVSHLTRDHRMADGTKAYMRWLYGQTSAVFSRSNQYRFNLRDLGLNDENLRMIQPGVNTAKFNPSHRDPNLWADLNVKEPLRLLYVGRVSVEKNLPLLVDAFRQLCRQRNDTALIVAGDGPYLAEMKKKLAGTPAYFLGFRNDKQLGALYAGSDLFVFPSRTDTLGQVVMEAQASGLPVVVSNEGGPKEMMEDAVTGMMLPATDARLWASMIDLLLADELRRRRMAHNASLRATHYSLEQTFDAFWADHLAIVEPPTSEHADVTAPDALPI
ncbi:MAG: glycosyltransferase [Anaerolineae bacterium]|nr:glycosyltransferase [Phycisphaerae bacterium]